MSTFGVHADPCTDILLIPAGQVSELFECKDHDGIYHNLALRRGDDPLFLTGTKSGLREFLNRALALVEQLPDDSVRPIVFRHTPQDGTLVLIPAADLSVHDLSTAVKLVRAGGATPLKTDGPSGSRFRLHRSRNKAAISRKAGEIAEWLREAGFTVEVPGP